jgi:hypothetical protein
MGQSKCRLDGRKRRRHERQVLTPDARAGAGLGP